MALTQAQYSEQVKTLLPVGAAWEQNAPGSVVSATSDATAGELARVDQRSDDLQNELDPSTATEMLTDWERVLGLPEDCTNVVGTLSQRRAAAAAKYALVGGQSPQYYIDLAAKNGFEITITEFQLFTMGSSMGDPITSEADIYSFQVNAPEETIRDFVSGGSQSGDRLREWGNEQLECLINKYKPAHTIATFAYGD